MNPHEKRHLETISTLLQDKNNQLFYETKSYGPRSLWGVYYDSRFGLVFNGYDWIESAHPVQWAVRQVKDGIYTTIAGASD